MQVILDGKARKWMWQLIKMNILLLMLADPLLTINFLGLYLIQTTLWSLV